jgi:monovalent cation/proton antiporter MnhG/PhaG subunit
VSTAREIVVSGLLLVGAAFALVGSIGLARLPDFYTRLHGPTKATTLGVGAMLVASAVWFSGRGTGVSLHELLVAGFCSSPRRERAPAGQGGAARSRGRAFALGRGGGAAERRRPPRERRRRGP